MNYNNIYININKAVKTSRLLQLLLVLALLIILHSQLSTPAGGEARLWRLNSAHADEQTLRVSPVIINVSLSPGKTHTHEVSIENLTNRPLPLRATLNDFITGGEEGGYIFETSKANPLLSWIDLSESEFILEAGEKKTLMMTITTPRSIPVGGYYGMLFFEPVLQNTSSAKTQVSSKVGVLMLANIGVPDPDAKKADILTFKPDLFSEDGTVPFLLRVQNVSLNFFTAKPEITLHPLLPLMNNTTTVQLEEKIIFPGQVRRWEEEATIKELSPNIYAATMKVSTGNGSFIEASRYIVVLPFIKILLLSIIVGALFLLINKRKRLRKAITLLFR